MLVFRIRRVKKRKQKWKYLQLQYNTRQKLPSSTKRPPHPSILAPMVCGGGTSCSLVRTCGCCSSMMTVMRITKHHALAISVCHCDGATSSASLSSRIEYNRILLDVTPFYETSGKWDDGNVSGVRTFCSSITPPNRKATLLEAL
jgi:hypothetical protein